MQTFPAKDGHLCTKRSDEDTKGEAPDEALRPYPPHITRHILNPLQLSHLASYDVASNIWRLGLAILPAKVGHL
jgi:hypothetical protein